MGHPVYNEKKILFCSNCKSKTFRQISVADPGFPVGGHGPRRGAWTPKAVTFRKFCMSKRKNLDPWGACAGHAP